MTIFPRFVEPWALLLLALVPLSIWLGFYIRSLSPGRKWTAIVLRSIILTCLVLALAGAELVQKSDKLAVFFVLDRSNSIPEAIKQSTVEHVKAIAQTYMTSKDEAGIIAFGEDASIELSAGPRLGFDKIRSMVSGEQTDLAAAIRLAMAAFPQGHMKRIVVYTDGNETRGSALEEVKLARSADIEVSVMPLMIRGGNEVRLREVNAPNRVDAGQPFQVRVVVHSDEDTTATLRLAQRVEGGRRLLPPAEVTLRKGDNVFLLPQELTAPGFYEYEASVESESDTILANNEGRAYTVIYGEPTVLLVDADGTAGPNLAPALQREGLRVVTTDLAGVPANLAQFQNYDAVILSNVSSTDLSSEQLQSMEALVRDLGVGLVMIGGPRSFGAGGFHQTPVERALPVNMDLKQRKVLPRGALVLIMHTCEIPDGNAWAREIGLASLNVLSSQDLMGALAWTGSGEGWVFELQPVGDKSLMAGKLKQANPGDMPAVEPTLRQAYDALKAADAAVKRIVIISDGDPAPPSRGLIQDLISAKIPVSTVCIAPHSMSDQDMLRAIADATGGAYYFVMNPKRLPQIFTKEAAVVKRGVLVEETFTPTVRHESELVLGYGGKFPELLGYVATTPKENATIPLISHEQDPVLAHWRYGLGKSVAFTSDVTSRWARAWLGWENFSRFWAQTVRWAMRDVQRSDFRVETRVREGKGYIRIDAVDSSGQFVNFLRPEGRVTGPGPDFKQSELSITQTGPGIYEGTFPLDDKGVYMLNVLYQNPDGSRGMIPAGLALDYSREYEENTTNLPMLEQIAALGGGRLFDSGDNPFQHNLVAAPVITPVWHWLAIVAVCLFPLEILVRRVVVDFGAVYVAIHKVLSALPGLTVLLPKPRLRPAPVTGTYGEFAAPVFDYSGVRGERVTFDGVAAKGQFGEAPVDTGADAEMPVAPREPGTRPGSSEYTRQLLAAKQRALRGRQRRTGPGDDKKESE